MTIYSLSKSLRTSVSALSLDDTTSQATNPGKAGTISLAEADSSICLDSGSYVHTSSQKELFINIVPHPERIWGIAGGSAVSEYKGTMTFTVKCDCGYQTLELHDALYFSPRVNRPEKVIPTLVSVSALIKQYPNARIQFTAAGCSVEMDQSQGQVICIPLKRGHYNFEMVKESSVPRQGCHEHRQDCEDPKTENKKTETTENTENAEKGDGKEEKEKQEKTEKRDEKKKEAKKTKKTKEKKEKKEKKKKRENST
ncbi:hypothetical protein N7488_000411 [Penicillium malachiteum]|nr:hypothetical protein N7488_000411 [Penicillium malachiteum]